jgi:hypothetical protein
MKQKKVWQICNGSLLTTKRAKLSITSELKHHGFAGPPSNGKQQHPIVRNLATFLSHTSFRISRQEIVFHEVESDQTSLLSMR